MGVKVETLKSLRQEMVPKLAALYPASEADAIFERLAMDWLGWNRTEMVLYADQELSNDFSLFFSDAMERLLKGEPMQYILGYTWFDGVKLKTDPRALIPRPETEELIDLIGSVFHVQSSISGTRNIEPGTFNIIDIGTGSGCIALALQNRFPYEHLYAVDISGDALELARENAFGNKMMIDFEQMDILDEKTYRVLNETMFNVIVSNPPYVLESEKGDMHPNVLEFEPHNALFVPENDPLLFYKAIVNFAKEYLNKDGFLFFEVNPKYAKEVQGLLISATFNFAIIKEDLSGKDRFVYGKL
jgi:release factor glutamine methyltransferase